RLRADCHGALGMFSLRVSSGLDRRQPPTRAIHKCSARDGRVLSLLQLQSDLLARINLRNDRSLGTRNALPSRSREWLYVLWSNRAKNHFLKAVRGVHVGLSACQQVCTISL